MRVTDRMARLLGRYGLMPLTPAHDIDVPHREPWPPNLQSSAVRPADVSPLRVVPGLVDGPAAPTSPGAAGIHPSRIPPDWREQLGWAHRVIGEALAEHDAGLIDLNAPDWAAAIAVVAESVDLNAHR